jgi:DNA repair protein RecO (recombination protein O)
LTDRQENTSAFVLRRTDYKDSDRILSLFTKAHGKISVSARGARKSIKRFAGALEPFVLLEVTIESSKTGRRMRRLTESAVMRGADGLSKRMARLNAASFVVEMFRESIPEEAPDNALFDLLDETLARLCDLDGEMLRRTVAAFQLKLLLTIGFGVSIGQCAGCGLAVPPGRPVYFHPARGGVICTACGGGPMLLSPPLQRP